MKVRIDEETCVGCGACVEECPELFEMPEDVAVIKVEEVPEGLQSKCRETSENCPVEAIILEE